MNTPLVRSISAGLLVIALAACAGAPPPAAAPSTDVNPVTGTRGGSGAK